MVRLKNFGLYIVIGDGMEEAMVGTLIIIYPWIKLHFSQ